jgi:hypothetical protein
MRELAAALCVLVSITTLALARGIWPQYYNQPFYGGVRTIAPQQQVADPVEKNCTGTLTDQREVGVSLGGCDLNELSDSELAKIVSVCGKPNGVDEDVNTAICTIRGPGIPKRGFPDIAVLLKLDEVQEIGFIPLSQQPQNPAEPAATPIISTADNSKHCRAADPTGAALTIRAVPNGKISDTIQSGVPVVIGKQIFEQGQTWVYISDYVGIPLGWVIREYLSCGNSDVREKPQVAETQQHKTLEAEGMKHDGLEVRQSPKATNQDGRDFAIVAIIIVLFIVLTVISVTKLKVAITLATEEREALHQPESWSFTIGNCGILTQSLTCTGLGRYWQDREVRGLSQAW